MIKKNKEASDKVIIILAVIAVIISIIGIQKMIGGELLKFQAITGLASSGSAGANVTVSTTLDISLIQNTINFTATSPGGSKSSVLGTDQDPACTAGAGVCGFNITNDGSVLVNISAAPQGSFFSGTVNANSFKCNVSSTITNYGIGSLGNTSMTDCRYSVTNGFEDFSPIISDLNFTDGSDDVYVDVDITVPTDEPSGYKGETIIFTASAAS